MKKWKAGGEWKYETIHYCPWDDVTEFAWLAADMYSHYKNGYLWFPGSIGQQPVWYIELMKFMSNEFGEIDRRTRKEIERQGLGL